MTALIVLALAFPTAWHLGRWHERSRIVGGTLSELGRMAQEEQDARIARWAGRRG